MIGGFQAVATALNNAYIWPGGREFDRRQIQVWDARQTRNKAGATPPAPVDAEPDVPALGRKPSKVYDTEHWVTWARSGVPGPRNKGWLVPRPRRRATVSGAVVEVQDVQLPEPSHTGAA
ncbi:MAG TPA: hypothetical protein VEV45_20755 [Streptosporangiaceae bacterium]|nr:hypothetical protein [Streptosporangiaceae bacterium]